MRMSAISTPAQQHVHHRISFIVWHCVLGRALHHRISFIVWYCVLGRALHHRISFIVWHCVLGRVLHHRISFIVWHCVLGPVYLQELITLALVCSSHQTLHVATWPPEATLSFNMLTLSLDRIMVSQ